MAKIKEIIARVDANKFNDYSDETKMRMVAVLDGKIAVDVLLMHPSETGQFNYTYPEGLEMEPLVHFPHDDLYEKWIEAQIDFKNGEYEKYQNSMEQFNASYENFVNWLLTYHTPEAYLGKDAGGTGGGPLYYITAYGLAVKQGFTGTLAEWLASLKGEKGDTGAFEDMTPEQIDMVAAKVTAISFIPRGEDVDSLVTPGRYACETAEIAKTLLGCPVDVPFTLDVRYANGKGPHVGQELRPRDGSARLYRQFVKYHEILSEDAKDLYERMQRVKPNLYAYGGNYDLYADGKDTLWYTGDKTEYVLEKASQLYGLAQLVNNGTTKFEGVTIKLGKDIVINDDDASTWGDAAPSYIWEPIGPSTTKYFAGTFDGQGHYISGLYNVKGRDNGFMCFTVNATIKNLAIINSYFENDAVGSAKEGDAQVLGTFAGRGYGITMENLYSDAVLVCSAKDYHTGGIAGFVKSSDTKIACGPATIANTVFKGTIKTNTGTASTLVGGIIGGTDASYATIRNSLFVGTIDTNDNLVGGIVGRIYQKTEINGCISVGTINKVSGKTVGAVVGQLYDAGTYTITDCYYSKEMGLDLYGGKAAGDLNIDVSGSKALSDECLEHSMVPTKWAEALDSEHTDYIVAQGSNKYWQWRKWASGIAECWTVTKDIKNGNDYHSAACDTKVGNVYTTAAGDTHIPWGYPFEFTELPTVNVTPHMVDKIYWIAAASLGSKTQAPGFRIVSPVSLEDSMGIIKFKLSMHVIGRWK